LAAFAFAFVVGRPFVIHCLSVVAVNKRRNEVAKQNLFEKNQGTQTLNLQVFMLLTGWFSICQK